MTIFLPGVSRMTMFVIPRIAAEHGKNFLASCKKVIIGTLSISLLTSIGAAIVVPPLIVLAYGQAYQNSIPVFLALLPINMIAAMHVISVPLLRVLRRVWVISLTNGFGISIAICAYFLLHMFLPTLAAISFAVLIYHCNSLLLFVMLPGFLRKSTLR
jgi:O-antigen/teichoic acid export membrane protein